MTQLMGNRKQCNKTENCFQRNITLKYYSEQKKNMILRNVYNKS